VEHQEKDWIARATTLSKNGLVKRRCSSPRDYRTGLRLSGHTRGSRKVPRRRGSYGSRCSVRFKTRKDWWVVGKGSSKCC
jgi:hypothetical protein